MCSNEPLGQPVTPDTIDVDADAPPVQSQAREESPEPSNGRKRKRGLTIEDTDLVTGMTDAIYSFASAVAEGNHSDAAPGIYEAVMTITLAAFSCARNWRRRIPSDTVAHCSISFVFGNNCPIVD